MPTTMLRSTEITVGLPLARAMELFTPEGERRWANGWDPQYPDPERREGPGAVFSTRHEGHETTWIMVECGARSVRYARVTQNVTAGTISVDAVGSREDSTQVRVTYDLTALSAAGERWLESFDADYDTAIGGWSAEIAAALERSG